MTDYLTRFWHRGTGRPRPHFCAVCTGGADTFDTRHPLFCDVTLCASGVTFISGLWLLLLLVLLGAF